MTLNYLRAILIRGMAALTVWAVGLNSPLAGQPPQPEVAAAARRVAATAQLAAEEYALGVSGGRIIAPPEVEEARLFLAEARRNVTRLPPATAQSTAALLTTVESMVSRSADPDSVTRLVKKLVASLESELHLALDEIPADPPSLSRGREIYQNSCAVCHGVTGLGD